MHSSSAQSIPNAGEPIEGPSAPFVQTTHSVLQEIDVSHRKKKFLDSFATLEALDVLSSVAGLTHLFEFDQNLLDAVNESFSRKQRQQLCHVMHITSVVSLD